MLIRTHDVAEGFIGGNPVLTIAGFCTHCFHLSLPQSLIYPDWGIFMSTVRCSRAPLSAAVLFLSCSIAVHAADESGLEKIYVSGTRSESAQLPLATTITVIDREQIRLSGASQLGDVLRTQAGIQLQDLDGSGGRSVTIAMRGFTSNAPNNTLVMVDGRKLNNPSLVSPSLNTIALKDVERIEIVQGSAGVLYGDQAVGGVINIVTRRAVRGEIHGSVQLLAGSDNLESYTATVNQGFTNGVSYNLSAQKRQADNYRDNNQADYENILGNLRYDFAAGHVFVEGQIINDDLHMPGSLSDLQVAQDRRQTNSPEDYANQETDILRVGGAVQLHRHWQLLAEYADRHEDALWYYEGFGEASLQELRAENITPRLIGRLPTANGEAVITLGYDKTMADYVIADRFVDIEQDINAVYGQIVYPVSRALAVTAGTRYSEVKDRNFSSRETHTDDLNAYELGINYQLNDAWRIFARYAEGFRFANADENAYTLPEIDFLKPQTSTSYEAGVVWQSGATNATATAYRMTVDNEILFDPSAGGYGVNINLPESERHGLILDADVSLNSRINLRANYTFTEAEQTSGTFKGAQVPFVAEHTANLAVVFNVHRQLSAFVDAQYTGPRYRIGDDANTQGKVPSVTVFNANILWSFQDVELGLRIKNLTNKKYSDYSGYSPYSGNYQYPQPERQYEAGLTYRF